MRDVFICHASEDKINYVYPLIKELSTVGITYWVDEAEIMWGDDIIKKINQGLQQSKYIIVIITKFFLNKNWPQSELCNALNIEFSRNKNYILPIFCIDENYVYERYPLLSSKRFIKWESGVNKIREELQRVLTNTISSEKCFSLEIVSPLWAVAVSATIKNVEKIQTEIICARSEVEAHRMINDLFDKYFLGQDICKPRNRIFKIPNRFANGDLWSIGFLWGKRSIYFNNCQNFDVTFYNASDISKVEKFVNEYIVENSLTEPIIYVYSKIDKDTLLKASKQ